MSKSHGENGKQDRALGHLPWDVLCSRVWSRCHTELHSKCWRASKLGPFLSSPAVDLEHISPTLKRLRLDDRWIWGPRSRLHTTPSSSSCLLLVLLQAQEASHIPKCIRLTGELQRWKMVLFLCQLSSHHKFPTLCYSVTSSGRGLFPSHLSSECRWRGWVWTLGSAPEGLQQKWWPLRDGMLICVGGMLALCSLYLLWMMVTTFIFCYYNRPLFKKTHMAASLNNFSSNMWLCSACLLDGKRTWGFSLT